MRLRNAVRISLRRITIMKTKSKKPATATIPKKWERHLAKLEGIREALLSECDLQESGVGESVEPGGSDDLDRASCETDHDLALGLLSHEENGLAEVEDAIQRIHDGTYGVCEATGERIPEARLRVVPWTRYTKAALERIEMKTWGKRPQLAPVFSIQDDSSGASWDAPGTDDSASSNLSTES
jgi:RNA polymerase-binding transcription factor DksA